MQDTSENEANMWKVKEILEQLEFERKRHIKMSGLVEDFDVSMEHLEAADRVSRAIKIIKCSLDCDKPST